MLSAPAGQNMIHPRTGDDFRGLLRHKFGFLLKRLVDCKRLVFPRKVLSTASGCARSVFGVPLRGAEQRRRSGGSRLALSEPRSGEFSQPPGPASSARDRAQPGADLGVAFFLATFSWPPRKSTPARQARKTAPKKPNSPTTNPQKTTALKNKTRPAISRPGPEIQAARPSTQTHAPSSVTPSAATFFGLTNCSRETPSHITSGLATRTDE